jgi:hypothetical protein
MPCTIIAPSDACRVHFSIVFVHGKGAHRQKSYTALAAGQVGSATGASGTSGFAASAIRTGTVEDTVKDTVKDTRQLVHAFLALTLFSAAGFR